MRALAVVVACALAACEPAAAPAPSPSTTTPAVPSPRPSSSALESLVGNTRNAIAWAPLSNPSAITVEGSVPRSRAWSTSKVLVIAAYLQTVVGGDPDGLSDEARGWIRDALTRSDGPALLALQGDIEGRPGRVMTRILRSIGDTVTVAPDSYVGTMTWTVGEQVRFMAALGNGQVVSPAASRFLLEQMQPIASQRWGLGSIGASAFKPGWVSGETETRQMGIVGDDAVAIITAGEGPVTRQSDGDDAHQWQLDRLAVLLAQRIGADAVAR